MYQTYVVKEMLKESHGAHYMSPSWNKCAEMEELCYSCAATSSV